MDDVEPSGQKYPAVQLPLHAGVLTPVWCPNRPGAQAVQFAAPPVLNRPTGHMAVQVPAVRPIASP